MTLWLAAAPKTDGDDEGDGGDYEKDYDESDDRTMMRMWMVILMTVTVWFIMASRGDDNAAVAVALPAAVMMIYPKLRFSLGR